MYIVVFMCWIIVNRLQSKKTINNTTDGVKDATVTLYQSCCRYFRGS